MPNDSDGIVEDQRSLLRRCTGRTVQRDKGHSAQEKSGVERLCLSIYGKVLRV